MLWGLPTAVFPPGEAIADDQCETEGYDQLGEEVLKVEYVDHDCNGNSR